MIFERFNKAGLPTLCWTKHSPVGVCLIFYFHAILLCFESHLICAHYSIMQVILIGLHNSSSEFKKRHLLRKFDAPQLF